MIQCKTVITVVKRGRVARAQESRKIGYRRWEGKEWEAEFKENWKQKRNAKW